MLMKTNPGKALIALGAVAGLALASTASAQEILRLTTHTPAQAFITKDILDVWAERVTGETGGTLEVQVFPAGTLGRDASTHLDMVKDGVADLAFIVPGYTPGALTEATVIELPNLIPSATIGSMAATRMVEEGLWPGQGMENIKILGMFTTSPILLATREKVETLEDVKGMNLQGAGPVLLATIEAIGATPVGGITVTKIAESLNRGLLDGTINEWVALTIFRVKDEAKYHLEVNLGSSPLALVMNREKYESLSPEHRAAIDKFSGQALASLFGEEFDKNIDAFTAAAMQDSDRVFSTLSPDQETAWNARIQTVIDKWIADTPNGQEIYDSFSAAIADLDQ